MSMQITGKVTGKQELESGTSNAGKTWQKRTFILTTDGQYPKDVAIGAFGAVCDVVSGLQKNQTVTAHIELESREYNGKWYTNVKAWKIEAGATSQTVQVSKPEPPPVQNNGVDDDVPF